MLNGHGDDIFRQKKEITANFSSNIYQRHEASDLHTFLSARLPAIHSYPEPDAASLGKVLAQKRGINPSNVCVTNGAAEAIYLIAQAFSGSRTGIVIPTFSEYEDACTMHRHALNFYQSLEEIDPELETCWICNPNNPNGKVYDLDFLTRTVENNPNILFIFDQSYEDFTDQPVWNVRQSLEFKNLILIHSMTKRYGIPGLRIGYITANAALVRRINQYRMPWSVNSLAIEAGKFLEENSKRAISLPAYLKETTRLQEKLNEINGLHIVPSSTHYFLCRLENKTGKELKNWLIDRYGILIRDASNFRGLDEHFFRIATQSPAENDRLVKAIQEWIQL